MDWTAIIALAALGITASLGVGAALSRRFDSSLSIREHREFKDAILGMIREQTLQMRRDDDRLEREINFLKHKCLREISEGK